MLRVISSVHGNGAAELKVLRLDPARLQLVEALPSRERGGRGEGPLYHRGGTARIFLFRPRNGAAELKDAPIPGSIIPWPDSSVPGTGRPE